MLEAAGFAFLVLTGEDEQATGKFNPRLNVIHEAGLFQSLASRRPSSLKKTDAKIFRTCMGLPTFGSLKGRLRPLSNRFAACLSAKN